MKFSKFASNDTKVSMLSVSLNTIWPSFVLVLNLLLFTDPFPHSDYTYIFPLSLVNR